MPTGGYQIPSFPATGLSTPGASSTAAAETPSGVPSFPGTGSAPMPTGTAAPSFPSSGFSFPVTDVSNSTGVPELITSVIYTTQIFTSTGCPKTVTDCPASSTILITSTIPLTTTVCEKTATPASATPEASTSAAPVGSAPGDGYGTGETPSAVTEAVSSTPVTEKVHVSTETLVYTVGTGSSAHAVTTEVASTSTETIYKTIYKTRPGQETPVASVSKEGETAAPTGGNAGPTTYTTLESTSTTTKLVTVYPSAPAASAPAASVPGNGYGTGSNTDVPVEGAGSQVAPTGGAATGECAPPTTVTVTKQETVTVTAGQSTPTSDVPAEGEDVSSAPYTPAESTPASESSPKPTGPVIPYPAGNGTVPSGASSGFLTQTRPVGSAPSGGFTFPKPSGTGVPVAPVPSSATTPLPSFVLPSESSAVPETTAAPVGGESSSAVQASATPSAAPPAGSYGGGYSTGGNYKRFFGLF